MSEKRYENNKFKKVEGMIYWRDGKYYILTTYNKKQMRINIGEITINEARSISDNILSEKKNNSYKTLEKYLKPEQIVKSKNLEFYTRQRDDKVIAIGGGIVVNDKKMKFNITSSVELSADEIQKLLKNKEILKISERKEIIYSIYVKN